MLDEVKTALRTAPGSVQARLGLEPDLTTVSKALGNGCRSRPVVGTRDVMSSAAGMHLSATYHGDTAAMAAALATLRIVDERERRRARLGTRPAADRRPERHRARSRRDGHQLTANRSRRCPFLRFHHPQPATNDALRTAFYEAMLERGVLMHPRHMWFISLATRGRTSIPRSSTRAPR